MIDFEGLSKGTSRGHYLTAMAFAKNLLGRERGGGSRYDREYFENAAKMEGYKSTLRREEARNKAHLGDQELQRMHGVAADEPGGFVEGGHLKHLREAATIRDPRTGEAVGQHSFSWGTTQGNRGSFSGYMHQPEDGDGDTSDDVGGFDTAPKVTVTNLNDGKMDPAGHHEDDIQDAYIVPDKGLSMSAAATRFMPTFPADSIPTRPDRQTLTNPDTGRQMKNPEYGAFKQKLEDQSVMQERQFHEYHAANSGLDATHPLEADPEPKA